MIYISRERERERIKCSHQSCLDIYVHCPVHPQLNELVMVESYEECITSIAQFTVVSFQNWQWAPNRYCTCECVYIYIC